MPTTNLTDEQRIARDLRDVSIALSAGAGCGKTHVLTARFLAHLDPDTAEADSSLAALRQLIAITFTDAAAREMRSRIRTACYDRLRDPALNQHAQARWLALLREIDTARVSTIHAFCTALLRAHAAEAGIDPTFGVLEQSEADVLQSQVIDDLLRERLVAREEATLSLAAAFGLARLKQQLSLLTEVRHQKAFDRWLPSSTDDAAEKCDELLAAWKERYDRDAFRLSLLAIADKAPIAELLHLLRQAQPAAGNAKLVAASATLHELLPQLEEGRVTPADLETIHAAAMIRGICSKNDWPSPAEFEAYKKVCTKLRATISERKPRPWNDAIAREAATLGLELLRLAADAADAYRVQKDVQGKLDFSDQLVLAHRLLTDPRQAALRDRIARDLRLLLVDEFQDTDPLQVELIKAVCGAGFDTGRLFFVGDFKQSIYRFRGATPPEFIKLRQEVPETGRLPLTVNFRSQPGVLHFVNALFCQAFPEYEALQPHRTPIGDAPAVEFLWTIAPQKNSGGKGSIEAARRQEAARVARRLRDLLDENCTETPIIDRETKARRRLKPGDVALLFRALSDVRLFEEALRDEGLDYYLVGGHAFYAQQEVYDVLNLLRSVASAADEVSLAGVLRSPFFALADESLFWLVERSDDRTLNSGLLAKLPPAELEDGERRKVELAAATMRHLRNVKDRVPVAQLLNDALARTAYDATILAEFLGERKLANLQKLLEQARAADAVGGNLDDFITQLADFIAQPPKEPLASTSPETADVIRLMTIHRAKGLEFPLVVVPDLDRPPRHDAPVAALDSELGPLVRPPLDDEQEESAVGMTLFHAAEQIEERDERQRLLYVAVTRAADYLILSSTLESYVKPGSDWMKLLASRFDLETGACVAQLDHEVATPRVHIAPPPADDAKRAGKSRGPDLVRLIDDARQLAADGGGYVPHEVAPIPIDHAAQRQFSVSRLSGALIEADPLHDNQVDSAGSERATSPLDPLGVGSLVHSVLQRMEIASPADIPAWCEQLAPLLVPLDATSAAAAAEEMLARFAKSPRAAALAAAVRLHREIDFLLPWTAGADRARAPSKPATNSDQYYFQGVIDCLYQDKAGDWHLIDYKTNDIGPAEVARTAKKYEMQMYLYALAAERALGRPPVELALHFLRPGVEHAFAWNDEARRQVIQMIDDAIVTTINSS